VLELSALGKPGDTIARAREQVIDILQHGNACSAWFQEADSDATEVFRSVHFELEMRGPSYVYGMRDNERGQLFKHPWAARSIENGGLNSTILLNANGPFFNRTLEIMQLDQEECYFSPAAIVCWWSLPTPETLRRRKLRYCFTNWSTLSGVFLRTTIPGTADLSETLPKCRGIARARHARPHTTVPGAAPRPTIPAFNPGNSQFPPVFSCRLSSFPFHFRYLK
jgi:hypothetical protein